MNVQLDEEGAAAVLRFIDLLDDHDDVQQVFANFEVSDAVLAKLSA
jgi:transcriptional/translational regulatory protein YebC/TACO1